MKLIKTAALLSLALLLCCNKPEVAPAPTSTEAITEAPPDMFVDPIEVENEQMSYHQGKMYFRHPDQDALVPAKCRVVTSRNPAEELRSLVGKLGRAPEPGEGLPIWPENPRLRDAFVAENGLAVLDFSQDYLRKVNVGATGEAYMVSSLLQAVFANFPKIEKVHILIQGEVAETFLGHIDIEFPLTRKHIRFRVIEDAPATLAPSPTVTVPTPTPATGTAPAPAPAQPAPQTTPPPGP